MEKQVEIIKQEDEKIIEVAKEILIKYEEAFKELAK